MSKREVKVCLYKCPAGCKTVSKSQRELKNHVRGKHPNFHFRCKHCSLEYKTYSAKFKHERSHKAPSFVCPFKGCAKGYYYERDLDQLKRIHTKRNLYSCPSQSCDKVYTTKGALKFHMKLPRQT